MTSNGIFLHPLLDWLPRSNPWKFEVPFRDYSLEANLTVDAKYSIRKIGVICPLRPSQLVYCLFPILQAMENLPTLQEKNEAREKTNWKQFSFFFWGWKATLPRMGNKKINLESPKVVHVFHRPLAIVDVLTKILWGGGLNLVRFHKKRFPRTISIQSVGRKSMQCLSQLYVYILSIVTDIISMNITSIILQWKMLLQSIRESNCYGRQNSPLYVCK